MKKFLFLAIMSICMVLTSCKSQFCLVYGVQLTGDGDGKFEVTFPQGCYAMDGKAALALNVGDSVMLNSPEAVATKEYVLKRGKKSEIKAMQRVNAFVADEFETFTGEGTYDLYLKGFVKETLTGLTFEVERHFTNRNDALRKAAVTDDCQFVK